MVGVIVIVLVRVRRLFILWVWYRVICDYMVVMLLILLLFDMKWLC